MEIISARTQNTKTYDLGNNRKRAEISMGFVHYKNDYSDPNEEYKDIDIVWEGNKITKAPYILEVNDLEITFTSKKTGTVQKMTLDKIGSDKSQRPIPWSFVGREAIWKNAAPNTDVVIEAFNEGVRFKRIIKTNVAPISAEFIHSKIVGTADDLRIGVKARDADGKSLKTIHTDIGGRITETLDISTSTIKYPIEIDPEITIQPTDKDATLVPQDPDTNYGADNYIKINANASYPYRGIIHFDASEISAGSTINTATLSLYYFGYDWGNPVGKPAYAYKITRDDWTETGVTWNSYKSGSAWTAGGGDFVTSNPSGDSLNFPASAGWMAWNVLNIVQDAVDNVSGSVNILVKTAEDQGTHFDGVFWTKEYVGDTSLRPKLVIDYTVPPATVSASEVMTLGDVLQKKGVFPRSLLDNTSLVDTIVRKADFKKAISEVITLVDSFTYKLFPWRVSVSETITLVGSFTRRANFGKIFSETISLVDTIAKKIGVSIILSEIINLVDSFDIKRRIWTFLSKSTSPTWSHKSKSTSPTWTNKSKSTSPTWTFKNKDI